MLHYEKKAFLKFFLIYFLSVAVLIFVSGFFYYIQMKNQFLKSEEFSMIEYARDIKMGNNLSKYKKEYRHSVPKKIDKFINIKNFKIVDDRFVKYIPKNKKGEYFQISKSTKSFNQKLFILKVKIFLIQIFLLLLFALISYRLAKNALKPLEKSISMLDKFSKDLIHDLNTPITSIKLNMQLLDKDINFKNNKALERIKKSVYNISKLHENLTILLQEETFQMQDVNIINLSKEVIQVQKQIYPKLNFIVEKTPLIVKTNENAMRQILQNIISNACKYNIKNGYVKIYTKDNKLFIEDSGTGISNPKKIFERSFSDKNSSGIGLDIVKRLAMAMSISIDVSSKSKGTTFILTMS